MNSLAPGTIEPELTRAAPPEVLERVASQIPVGRLGDVEEVGAMAVYLTSEAAGFVVGCDIRHQRRIGHAVVR